MTKLHEKIWESSGNNWALLSVQLTAYFHINATSPVSPVSPFPLYLGVQKSACCAHLPSCLCCGLWFLFRNFTLESRLLKACVWKRRQLPLRATLSSFYLPPSPPSPSPLSFSFSLTAEQLGRLTAQNSAQRSSTLASYKLIFYLPTVARPDPSSHTCLTHTHGGSLIFFLIFRHPQKCWFVL